SGSVFARRASQSGIFSTFFTIMTHSQQASASGLCREPTPRFCPRCQQQTSGRLEPTSCPYCGDPLVPQGYCPVCEDYLRLPVGAICPKHDLVLESEAPPRPRFHIDGKPFRWVTISQFADSLAAEAPRIRLEAEGIPTFVEGERMGSRTMYHVATGG